MSFSDSHMFSVCPETGLAVHKRDMGEKVGGTYKDASWADAVINNVRLDESFAYEDEISRINEEKEKSEKEGNCGVTIVNSRDMSVSSLPEDSQEDNHWFRRLKKMKITPNTFKESKERKPSKNKRTSKPKTKIQVSKSTSQEEKFMSMVNKNDCSEVLVYELLYQWNKSKKRFTYIPPVHWIEPEIKWKEIWLKMDEIDTGKKRDYHYIEVGEPIPGCQNSQLIGPAIFFYEKDSDDLNFNFRWDHDFNIAEYHDGTEGLEMIDSLITWRPLFNREPNDVSFYECENIISYSRRACHELSIQNYINDPSDYNWFTYSYFEKKKDGFQWRYPFQDPPAPIENPHV